MEFTLTKATVGGYNKGNSRAANNCRYKGATPCWVLKMDGEIVTALKRKSDGECLLNFCMTFWDGKGDVVVAANKAGVLPTYFKGEC